MKSNICSTVLLILLMAVGGINTACQKSNELTFEQSTQKFESANTYQIELGDIDGDGDLDAVFSNMHEENNSTVWFNDGKGVFTDSGQRLIFESHGAAFSDVDSDGDLDLFLTDNDDFKETANKLYYNDGKGIYTDSGKETGLDDMNGNSAKAVDVNFDGKLDIQVDYYKAPNKIYFGNDGGFSSESDMEFPDGTFVYWGDIDSDGDMDIFAKVIGQGLLTRLNDGKGGFEAHWQFEDKDLTFGDAVLADFDGDKDLDAFVTNGDRENINASRVFLNDGTGRFEDSGQIIPSAAHSKAVSADFNNDGFPDVFFANMRDTLRILLNDGSGNLIYTGLQFGGDFVAGVNTVGDLDNDGDIDIFIAGYNGSGNQVWFNMIK